MALGISGKIKSLKAQLDPTNRYIDAAIRLAVCGKTTAGYERIRHSDVIGGVWDSWQQCFTDLEPKNVPIREVTEAQLDYCLSDRPRITGAGGRGGGKSEAMAQRIECLLLSKPGEHGLVVSPDYKHTEIVWTKVLKRVHRWTLPGTQGIHRTDHLLRFVFGSTIRFLSADNPDSLRGWDAHWAGIDEEKDVPDAAIDIVMLCLRLSAQPLIFGAGTPEIGEYSERYNRLEGDKKNCAVYKFPSRDNVFIPHAIFDLAKSQMDERRYRQEVLAEFVQLEDRPLVADGFDRKIHLLDVHKLKEDRARPDITRQYTARKLRRAYRYVAGVDYNYHTPNVAWIYKIFAPNLWVVVDIVKAKGLPTALAKVLIDKGYSPSEMLIVDDASGEYNNQRHRKSPHSSARLMRECGFTCVHPSKNPVVKDRINAFLAKLVPAEGPPTWGYSRAIRKEVEEVMDNLIWNKRGDKPDFNGGYQHDFDGCSYPIHFFEPAVRVEIPQVKGIKFA